MGVVLRIRIEPIALELRAHGAARLLDLVDEAAPIGFPLSCRGARCGICLVRVLRGAEHVEDPAQDERETLSRLGAHGDARLACQLWSRRESQGELVLRLNPAGAPAGS